MAGTGSSESRGGFLHLREAVCSDYEGAGIDCFTGTFGQGFQRPSKKKSITTTFGKVAINNQHPFSHWPGAFKFSPLCQERILYCGQLDVYQQASELLVELADIQVSDSTIQRMSVHYGELLGKDLYDAHQRKAAIAEQSESAKPAATAPDDDVLYCQFDGGFIFSDTDWREVKLGRTFLKSDCQLTDNEHRGNRIVRSEYAASLGHFSEFTDKYEVLIREGQRADRSLVFITDGAVWMRNWMREHYPEATQILDFFHVCEHLGDFAKEVVGGLGENHHRWYDQQKQALKQGKLLTVIDRIQGLSIKSKTAQAKREKLLKYFRDNAYRMRYDAYREAGYMIGSGPIEAAHRSVVQKRMKLSGQRWSSQGAQPMLNLRCAFKSGRRIMLRKLINQGA